jgi:hypothetical protein
MSILTPSSYDQRDKIKLYARCHINWCTSHGAQVSKVKWYTIFFEIDTMSYDQLKQTEQLIEKNPLKYKAIIAEKAFGKCIWALKRKELLPEFVE